MTQRGCRVSRRVLCPKHEEETPSCVVYDDKYHCFGCGANGPIADLGLTVKHYRTVPEDLEKSLAYIKTLPVQTVRGLSLPCDSQFYYIVWPTGDYYKKRVKNPGGSSKYLCPTGHSMPLLEASVAGRKTLAIVEGEINALSLAACYPPFDVVSPGGAATFAAKKYLNFYKKYDRIVIIADADSAGLKAAIELKTEALKWTPKVIVSLVEEDANDLLLRGGKEGVRHYMEKLLGVSVG